MFPAGIPVGTITESRRDPDELLAYARARPAASLAGSRQLLALWFEPANPAAPADPKLTETLPEAPVASPVTAAPGTGSSATARATGHSPRSAALMSRAANHRCWCGSRC